MSDRAFFKASVRLEDALKFWKAMGIDAGMFRDNGCGFASCEVGEWTPDDDLLRTARRAGCRFHGFIGPCIGVWDPDVFACDGERLIMCRASEYFKMPVVPVPSNGEVDMDYLNDARTYWSIMERIGALEG